MNFDKASKTGKKKSFWRGWGGRGGPGGVVEKGASSLGKYIFPEFFTVYVTEHVKNSCSKCEILLLY